MKISITIHKKILHITKFQNLKKKNSKKRPTLLSRFTIIFLLLFFHFFLYKNGHVHDVCGHCSRDLN